MVARFEHGIDRSNSVDILNDGLQMFMYQDGSVTTVINDFALGKHVVGGDPSGDFAIAVS